jgi:hypothetical protein
VSPSVNIQLTPGALRKALDLLEAGDHATLDDLVEALIVQRTNGNAPEPPGARDHLEPATDVQIITRPPGEAPLELADPVAPVGQLQFLTNRFGPIKLAARVLANMSLSGAWPELADFQARAASVARQVGQRLRAEDAEQGRRGVDRRWVAYPVGEGERAAFERYVFSFTLFPGDAEASGALAQLGLANIDVGRAVLTPIGWEFAATPSPTLDGAGLGTLSADEVGIVRSCLRRLPPEAAAITEFIKAVRTAAGVQGRVDELLGAWHADWTVDRAAAERSAMLGRLGELGVLRVTGRGPNARIELVDSVEFEKHDERG